MTGSITEGSRAGYWVIQSRVRLVNRVDALVDIPDMTVSAMQREFVADQTTLDDARALIRLYEYTIEAVH